MPHIGCSGWSYADSVEKGGWVKVFYPHAQTKKLQYYSQFFNTAEMDATFYEKFYKYTTKETFVNMAKATPDNFQFSVKIPEIVTHDKKFNNVEKELTFFYDAMKALKDKLLALLIQFRPYVKITEGLEALKQDDFFFDDSFRYSVEVRHPSWFSDLAYNFFSNNNICMVWNQLEKIQSPPIVTSDFVYLRLIGDRSIKEQNFGKIQKDREQEMEYWFDKFRTAQQDENDVKAGIVAANNHYAGFGAATANMFRMMNNLPPVEWGIQKDIDYNTELELSDKRTGYHKPKQKSLLDYPSS
jgi:uncharacterized protein YecE (DUF72 family)